MNKHKSRITKEAPCEILSRIREVFDPAPSIRLWATGLRVVDCGCGEGDLYPQFAEVGFEYWGLDRSSTMLAVARARWPEARFVDTLLQDVRWPMCFGAFDVAVCRNVLSENTAYEVSHILSRFKEALSLGGLFVVVGQDANLIESTSELELVTTWRGQDSTGRLFRKGGV